MNEMKKKKFLLPSALFSDDPDPFTKPRGRYGVGKGGGIQQRRQEWKEGKKIKKERERERDD